MIDLSWLGQQNAWSLIERSFFGFRRFQPGFRQGVFLFNLSLWIEAIIELLTMLPWPSLGAPQHPLIMARRFGFFMLSCSVCLGGASRERVILNCILLLCKCILDFCDAYCYANSCPVLYRNKKDSSCGQWKRPFCEPNFLSTLGLGCRGLGPSAGNAVGHSNTLTRLVGRSFVLHWFVHETFCHLETQRSLETFRHLRMELTIAVFIPTQNYGIKMHGDDNRPQKLG